MEFKKSMIILILAIFLVSIAGVCAADANETVTASEDANQMDVSSSNVIDEDNLKTSEGNAAFTQANDDESDSQTLSADEGNYSNLRTDIENGGNLTKSYYRYHEGDGDTIEITNPMTINGNGAVIDMAGSNIRAFYVSASPVIIKNLTIKNANYSGDGGAIYFGYGSSGTFEYCNFTNNTATGGGAAVYYYFEISGTFEYCNFANNTATGGGAVYMDSGTVENCNFTDNAASDGVGGAVYFGSTQISTVSNCNFVNNTATGGGGAVYFKGESRLSNSNFTDNKVTSDMARGGAVFLSRECIVTNCNFAGNIAPNHCGAIYMFSGTVGNCNFTNNRANGDNGRAGAIYFSGISFVHTVSNCIFTDNHAVVGADIYADKDGVTADTCIFKNASQTTYRVTILPPTLNVDNFTTVYNSGEKLTFDLKTNEGTPVYNGNISISVYYKNNNSWFVNCSCLSGEGWNVDLPAGLYYAVFNTEYAEFKPINRTITIIPDTSFWALNHAINANDTSEVNLANDYCYDPDFDGEFADGIVINRRVTINGNGHTINAQGKARVFSVAARGVTINNLTIKNANHTGNGGAIYFSQSGSVTNCNFTNNQATGSNPNGNGGAVYFDKDGDVTNCNFINNNATYGGAVYFFNNGTVTNCNFTNNQDSVNGGAVYFRNTGNVTNCNFTGNTATNNGGAIRISSGTVTNCNFTGNNAPIGSSIFFNSYGSAKTISNSIFLNNLANAESLEIIKNDNNITITFKGKDNLLNAIYSPGDVNFANVTYWGANGIANTDSSTPSRSKNEAGQNITVGIVVNDKLVLDNVYVTDENGMIVLDISAGDNYYISVRHDADSYYTEAERTITNNTKFNVNVTSQTTTNKTVNITAKSNIFNEFMPGKLLFILPNNIEINATYASNGTWWAVHTFEDYACYQLNASYIGLDNVTVSNATINITKANSTVEVGDAVLNYGEIKNVIVTAQGATGITATIDNNPVKVINNYTIVISDLDVGTHTLTVTTIADEDHNPVTRNATITVNKAKTELSAKAVKTTYNVNKNLVITLKDSTGKALSGVKVSVNLKGTKTYTTDKNGQIKINVAKLVPKTYTAKVTFEGNANYLKSTADVKVTVKKAKPKITAKKKTYKLKSKNKKFTITLKDNKGKAIKKAKVTVKVIKIKKSSKKKSKKAGKKNILKAKTNKKGKATFKINRNSKGKYQVIIKYKGNKYYKSATKKVKIKIK